MKQMKDKTIEPETIPAVTSQPEIERNDIKTIPVETLTRWVKEKVFEENGTVMNDLILNADKVIARYNAGKTAK
jgi:hypothetical protein